MKQDGRSGRSVDSPRLAWSLRTLGSSQEWTPARAVLLLVAVGCAYAAGSEMAYEWFDADGTSASFFPAAGVTMSALLTFDRRWWPSVLHKRCAFMPHRD